MGVTLIYHFDGKFVKNGTNVSYSGGDVVSIADMEPDMMNSFDLDVDFKSKVRVNGNYEYYYKKPLEGGVDTYQVIVNDHHIRDLLQTYESHDVYDIYVKLLVESMCKVDASKSSNHPSYSGSEESERDKESYTSEESESDDSDFEVGAWISDDDREEAEVLRKKVQEIKEKVKNGIPFPNHFNGDGYESEELAFDDNGYYVETDSDDETADHGVRRKNPYLMYNRKSETPYFETTMMFTSLDEVRTAVIKHSIKEKRDVKYVKNESYRIRLKCKYENCSWMFFVSLNKRFQLWQLKKYKEHVCPEHYKNKHVSPKFIAQHYKKQIKDTPRWKNKDIRDTVREDFGVVVTTMQCSRAKKLVLKKTFGAYEAEYAILRTYGEEILRITPGSTVKIMVDTNNPKNVPHFQRMYICFESLKKGFLASCRKIIALDGCFLKGLCKGELLTAVGRDANDQMYVIACWVVEVESKSSWEWFLELLQEDLNMGNGAGWCFSSDQQKGLVPSIASLFPSAEHRLCARHIYNNWRKKHKDPSLQQIFWNCAKASTDVLFNRQKEEIIRKNKEAAEAMVNIDPKHWSRAFFSTTVKCDSVDNNLSESFNALILEARHKPIFSMLEDIRVMCMEQIAMRRATARSWKSIYCPKILLKLAANANETRYCRIIGNGKEGYEVTYKHEDRFRVQLDEGKCSCRSWDLTGIPCSHSITCIISENKDPQRYILDCYKVQTYWNIYDHVMEPMDGYKSWTPSTYEEVRPPLMRKMPGRPKKNRIRSVEEKEDKARKRKRKYTDEELLARDKSDPSKMSRVGRVMTCKSCKKEGHNTRTCSLRKAGGMSQGRRPSSTIDNSLGAGCTQESSTTSNVPRRD